MLTFKKVSRDPFSMYSVTIITGLPKGQKTRRQNGKCEILLKIERERAEARESRFIFFFFTGKQEKTQQRGRKRLALCVLYLIHFQVDREKHADKESGHLPHFPRLHRPSSQLSFSSTCCLLLIVTAPNQSSQ